MCFVYCLASLSICMFIRLENAIESTDACFKLGSNRGKAVRYTVGLLVLLKRRFGWCRQMYIRLETIWDVQGIYRFRTRKQVFFWEQTHAKICGDGRNEGQLNLCEVSSVLCLQETIQQTGKKPQLIWRRGV